jgi:hypothetical protein
VYSPGLNMLKFSNSVRSEMVTCWRTSAYRQVLALGIDAVTC